MKDAENVCCTGLDCKAVPRFGELSFRSCFPLLPQLACSVLATWEWSYSPTLYIEGGERGSEPPTFIGNIGFLWRVETGELRLVLLGGAVNGVDLLRGAISFQMQRTESNVMELGVENGHFFLRICM